MEQRLFGNTNRKVSAVGQGTWYLDEANRSDAVSALRAGLDLGMNHIDTAEMYGSGAAEEVVGEAIVGRREEVFLVSKVLPHNASRRGTIEACERSLRHLRTDYLDCYLLHWSGPHPLEATFAAFAELERAGKIRSWGVSNFDEEDLDDCRAAGAEGQLACNQVLYHLEERAIEHAVIPHCRENGIAVVGYSPFGHNQFPRPASPGGKLLREIAEAHGATPRQVALRYLLRYPSVFVIPKASSMAHVRENAGAAELCLSPSELESIGAAFPRGPKPRSLPML